MSIATVKIEPISLIDEIIQSLQPKDFIKEVKIPRVEQSKTENILDLFENLLTTHRVSERVKNIVLERMQGANDLETSLENIFHFEPVLTAETNGVLVVAGTPGAGKSIVAAKIALEAVLMQKDVELITTDTLKAGGTTQIQTYAHALEVPFKAIESADKLDIYLKDSNPETLKIIDTMGINPFEKAEMGRLIEIVFASKKSPILVHPVATECEETQDQLDAFKQLGISSLIGSKVDMSKRIGGLISACVSDKIMLSHFSKGPELGNRLHIATANNLKELLTRPSEAKEMSPKRTPFLLN
ncbi:flagellar biosynthesis protein FlhF [Candidatus Nucleicultrix amoebiphila]|jgi:flagellar biosynthesis protein FlhF|uniref:SRP54-type proteins GTP-binding domain-containing protein n=1 Tax=Candidatus Nucleicultrix amoebiphila FS5 TaxID=1414854 RepID=A0A1W6N5Z8_9PROT|nr:hypothetical protein [Candidatus Nucleicultrix amoebiphila]ARN85261.1 hypothetical protein GQ61_08130 [Candidatus Nucleicultrix amoebiphila FS5]